MKITNLFPTVLAVLAALLMGGCSSGKGGKVGTRSNGFSSPPVYVTGSATSPIGYVKVYFSKTTPTPPVTTWYLDGTSRGLVTASALAVFVPTSRVGHTVSFTCLGNNHHPAPVGIDLKSNQRATIAVFYK